MDRESTKSSLYEGSFVTPLRDVDKHGSTAGFIANKSSLMRPPIPVLVRAYIEGY